EVSGYSDRRPPWRAGARHCKLRSGEARGIDCDPIPWPHRDHTPFDWLRGGTRGTVSTLPGARAEEVDFGLTEELESDACIQSKVQNRKSKIRCLHCDSGPSKSASPSSRPPSRAIATGRCG